MEVLVNQSEVIQGMFFQDQEMKQVFAAYPELVCVDATYKLLKLHFPVYLMLIEYGIGLSKIVAMFLLLEENEVSISSMVNAFKKYNRRWEFVAFKVTTKLTSLASEATGASYYSTISLLKRLVTAWEENKKVFVTNGKYGSQYTLLLGCV